MRDEDCIAEFVLQEAWLQEVCIAIQKLYCEVQWQETRLPVSQDRQLCRERALG